MTDDRFLQIERLIEDAGRVYDPVTGLFESVDDVEEIDTDLDPQSFLGLLGITQDECAEYVQQKMHAYDQSLRNA